MRVELVYGLLEGRRDVVYCVVEGRLIRVEIASLDRVAPIIQYCRGLNVSLDEKNAAVKST